MKLIDKMDEIIKAFQTATNRVEWNEASHLLDRYLWRMDLERSDMLQDYIGGLRRNVNTIDKQFFVKLLLLVQAHFPKG